MNCPQCGKNHQSQQTAKICAMTWNYSIFTDVILGNKHIETIEEITMKEYFDSLPVGKLKGKI